MEWSEWSPFYNDIIEKLEIDPNGDYEATATLSRLLTDIDPDFAGGSSDPGRKQVPGGRKRGERTGRAGLPGYIRHSSNAC